ncbi:hypothetical protein IWZ00DRAFT_100038 [Phyllosticta capitalensis]|uniref:Uncharacterized protein n=1 Tax=Phyllosticta capitalensis TaxID=121624 RepID=A0ABR1YBP7_9PEZI
MVAPQQTIPEIVIYGPPEEQSGRAPITDYPPSSGRTPTSFVSSAGRSPLRNTSPTSRTSTSSAAPSRHSSSGYTSSSARTCASNMSLAGRTSTSYTARSRYSSSPYASGSVPSGYVSPYPALPHDRIAANNSNTTDLPYPIMSTSNHATRSCTNPAHRSSSIVRPLDFNNATPRPTSSTAGTNFDNSPFEYTEPPTADTPRTWIKLKPGTSMTPVELAILNNLGVLMARVDALTKLVMEREENGHGDGYGDSDDDTQPEKKVKLEDGADRR